MFTTSIIFGFLFFLSLYRMYQLRVFIISNLDSIKTSLQISKNIQNRSSRLSLALFLSFMISISTYALS